MTTRVLRKISAAMILTLFSALFAYADEAQDLLELRDRLQKFKANPAQQMQVLPKKKFIEGDPAQVIFKQDSIADKNFVTQKDSQRQDFCKMNAQGIRVCVKDGNGRAGIKENDRPEDLVDLGTKLEKNLAKMDDGLRSGKLAVQPWSDSYWPIYQGILGARYTHADYPDSEKFVDFLKFKNDNPIENFFTAHRPTTAINTLSPSEKYDLLIGDENGLLTQSMWDQGKSYLPGKVDTWMGICHGWAAAAYMEDRPKSAVKIPVMINANGENKEVELTFYPSDIKALTSYMWANSKVNSRFIGGRCNDKKPAMSRNGRVKDADCFDTNPGAWHQVVVNQIGKTGRSFVMDVTFDHEVWNQPVYAYRYTYFNPKTLEPTRSLRTATVPLAEMGRDDKFSDERDAKAVSLVGISMTVIYIVETDPSKSLSDSTRKDAKTEVTYEYDLELDSHGNIIGGEWYTNLHPDFIWTPSAKDEASSNYDDGLRGRWDGQSTLPANWQTAAQSAAAEGDVLSHIVKGLIKASNAQ